MDEMTGARAEAGPRVPRRRFLGRLTLAAGVLFGGRWAFPGPGEGTAAEAPVPTETVERFIGEVITVPYDFAPRGFAFCEGQTVPVAQNQALFSLIGNFYGGDGRTSMKLPDTRALEAAAKKVSRASRPPFRYAIALSGTYPGRP